MIGIIAIYIWKCISKNILKDIAILAKMYYVFKSIMEWSVIPLDKIYHNYIINMENIKKYHPFLKYQ